MGGSDMEIEHPSPVGRRPEPVGEVREGEINSSKFKLDASLHEELEEKIQKIISKNMDAFAWSTIDMSGINPDSCVII